MHAQAHTQLETTTNVQREPPFVPELIEPTVSWGSPAPRRRTPAKGSEFPYKDMQPMVLPSGALTHEAMVAAFGPAAMFCAAHSPTSSEGDQEALNRLKDLDMSGIICHFRSADELLPAPVATAIDTPRLPVAGSDGAVH